MRVQRRWTVWKHTTRQVPLAVFLCRMIVLINIVIQVALKRFVDDIAVEAIEENIIAKLDGILSPMKVTCLAADVVTEIAGESEESRTMRKQFTNQLNVLSTGLETCR